MDRRVIRIWLPVTVEGPEVDDDVLEAIMPAGAEIVSAEMIDDRAALWIVANIERRKMSRHFQLVATNAPMRQSAQGHYLATLAFLGGATRMHLFDLGEREWVMPTR